MASCRAASDSSRSASIAAMPAATLIDRRRRPFCHGRPWRRASDRGTCRRREGRLSFRVDGIGRGWLQQWQHWVTGDPHQLGCVKPSARGSSSKGQLRAGIQLQTVLVRSTQPDKCGGDSKGVRVGLHDGAHDRMCFCPLNSISSVLVRPGSVGCSGYVT